MQPKSIASVALSGILAMSLCPASALADDGQQADDVQTQGALGEGGGSKAPSGAGDSSSVETTEAEGSNASIDGGSADGAAGSEEGENGSSDGGQSETSGDGTSEESSSNIAPLPAAKTTAQQSAAAPLADTRAAGDVVASGNCGNMSTNCTYQIILNDDLSTHTLKLQGTGVCNRPSALGTYASTVTRVEVGEGITDLSYEILNNLTALTDVSLPDSLTSIRGSLFKGCTALESIVIPGNASVIAKSNGLFDGCTSLKNVTLPSNATSIGSGTFRGCTALESIELPSGLTSLNGTFQGCTSLADIEIPDSVTTIGSNAFRSCTALGEVAIPDGVTTIGSMAFSGCTSLSSVSFPDGLTTIGSSAFADCEALKSVDLPSAVTNIQMSAFANSGLTSLDLSGCVGLTSVGNNAFNGCAALASVAFPSDGTFTLGAGSFVGTALTDGSVTGLTETQIMAFGTNVFPAAVVPANEEGFSVVDGVLLSVQGAAATGEVTIPSDVKEIAASVFSGNQNITKITLPATVTKIGERAFYQCNALEEVAFAGEDGIVEIGASAFSYCSKLATVPAFSKLQTIGSGAFSRTAITSFTIPDSVTSIGAGAFESCSSLKTAKVESDLLGSNSFRYCKSLESVELNSSITAIPDSAFNGCSALASVAGADSVTSVGSMTFYGSLPQGIDIATVFPKLETIGSSAFNGTGITSLMVPATVTTVGQNAFQNCKSLTAVDWDSPANVPQNCFAGCASLAEADISGVKSLGSNAFLSCSALKSVVGIGGVIEFGSSAFSSCSALGEVTFSKDVETIGMSAFSGTALSGTLDFSGCAKLQEIGASAFKNCTGVTGLDFTGCTALTSIGSQAFRTCALKDSSSIKGYGIALAADTNGNAFPDAVYVVSEVDENGLAIVEGVLVSAQEAKGDIVIPDTVTLIMAKAFQGNQDITSVVVPEGISSIPDYCFDECINLKSVELPSTLKTIGDSAFSECRALAAIELPEGLASIGGKAFAFTALESVVVPGGCNLEGSNIFLSTPLRSIVFEEGFAELGRQALGSSLPLQNIQIPSTFTFFEGRSISTANDTPVTFVFCNPTSNLTVGGEAWNSGLVDGSKVVIHGDYAEGAISALTADVRFGQLAPFVYEDHAYVATSDAALGNTEVEFACETCGKTISSTVGVTEAPAESDAVDAFDQLRGADPLLASVDVSLGEGIAAQNVDGASVTIEVSAGQEYAGQMVYILSYAQGDEGPVATQNSVVVDEDGMVRFTASRNATYGVVYDLDQVQHQDLIDQVEQARTLIGSVQESETGEDVFTDQRYASKEQIEAFDDAIGEAEALLASGQATQGQVDAALQALTEAVQTFESALSYGKKPVTANLNALIGQAALALQDVQESENGAGVPTDQKWVTPLMADMLKDALDRARAALEDPNATQQTVDDAYVALQQVLEFFNSNAADGLGTAGTTGQGADGSPQGQGGVSIVPGTQVSATTAGGSVRTSAMASTGDAMLGTLGVAAAGFAVTAGAVAAGSLVRSRKTANRQSRR